MRILDLIEKKKQGKEHTQEEINFMINSLLAGIVQDYQVSAWLMAIYFQGLSEDETVYLTKAIIESGHIVDLGEISKNTLDIYSTGGAGDTVGIILVPLLSSMGIPIIKLTGKEFGYTATTIDKLESIPGFNADIVPADIPKYLSKIGCAISSNIRNVTPVNRKLHALKFNTRTLENVSLIAAAVVSKKVATGADNIIVDVKYGSGALMKTTEDAEKLANLIINVGKKLDKSITAFITSLDEPLGRTVGNSIEIIEAIEFLKGNTKSDDLAKLVYEVGSTALLQMGKFDSKEKAIETMESYISTGKALDKFREIIKTQKGNDAIINNYDKLPRPKYKIKYISEQAGYVNRIDAYKIADGCKLLGSVRERRNQEIDKGVGIYLNKKTGEYVEAGETLFTIYSNKRNIEDIKERFIDAYQISENKNDIKDLVYKIIRNN